MTYDGNPEKKIEGRLKYQEGRERAVAALKANPAYVILQEKDQAVHVMDPAQDKAIWIKKKWLRQDGTLSTVNLKLLADAEANSGSTAQRRLNNFKRFAEEWDALKTDSTHVVNLSASGNFVTGRIAVYSEIIAGVLNSSIPEEESTPYDYEVLAGTKALKIAVHLKTLLEREDSLCVNLKINSEFHAELAARPDNVLIRLARKYRLGLNLLPIERERNPSAAATEKDYNLTLCTLTEEQKIGLLELNPEGKKKALDRGR